MICFSVIIPTYQRNLFLKNCLESILSQDYPIEKFEIIVVDNSPDNSAEDSVISFRNEIGRDIKYVSEKRAGLVYARHAGAKVAKFGLLAFTDDDGVYDKNWLKEIDSFLNHNEVVAVGGKILIKWDEEPSDWVREYEHLMGRLDYGDVPIAKHGLFINGGNFIIKKEVLYKMKGFNPGQLGDYLAGDSETGLCRKLHQNNYFIGWAPNAVMYHCQSKKKNATEKDISRRYFNNGLADGYNFIYNENRSYLAIILRILKVIFALIHILGFKYIAEDKRRAGFSKSYLFGELNFYFKSFFFLTFKKIMSNKDWELK